MAPWEVREGTEPYPDLDTSFEQVLLFIGRKGTGKSLFAGAVMRQWPADTDRLVMDINADMDLSDLDPIRLPSDPPLLLPPRRRRDVAETYWWQPDPSRGSFRDDVDRVVSLALFPKERRVLLDVDEAGVVFKVQQTGPHGTTAVHQGRHHHVPLLACMPRPKTVEPLLLTQADRIHMWDVPNPADRKHIADFAGIPLGKLSTALDETRRRGPHWALLFVAQPSSQRGFYRLPPLPLAA